MAATKEHDARNRNRRPRRVIKANYPGSCVVCGAAIPSGSLALWTPGGRLSHLGPCPRVS